MRRIINTPLLRFANFTGNWALTNVGELGKVIGGGTPSSKNQDYWDGDIPWISSSDLTTENIYEIKITRLITKDAISNSATKLIPEKSILIVSRVGVGKVAVNEQIICTSQDFSSIIPLKDDYVFLAYLIKIKTNKLLEFNQGTSIKGFVKSDLESLEISIPSIAEQEKIAAFLTAVDDKIQLLNKKKTLLKQYKKGVMQQIFNQQMRFKDDDGNDYPDWEERTLGEVCEIKSGNSPSKYNLKTEGSYPFLKVEELNNCIKYQVKSREYTSESHFLIPENSIIFPKRGAAILNNKVRINLKKVIIDSNLMSLIAIPDLMHYEFLYYVIVFVKLFKIADTSSIPQINNKHITPYLIQNPIIEEQIKIANFLSSLDDKINFVNQQITQTKQFKKGLLQQMFV